MRDLSLTLALFPGMTGMEAIVRQGAQSALPAGKRVAVIDGAKAGVQLLSGLVSCQYFG